MKLSEEIQKNIIRLTPEQQKSEKCIETLALLVYDAKKAGEEIQVLFIEGLDMWAPKSTADFNANADFIDELGRFADKHNVVLIGSVGCAKQKPKDRYEMQRDLIFGSVARGRKCETIVFLQFSDLKDTNSARQCFVLTRQGQAEKYTLTFENGELVETVPSIRVEEVKRSKLETYLATLSTGALLTWDES